MIQALFHTAIYQPIYNALAFLVGVIPGSDVGIAIILLTILVKLILFPLSLVATRTQLVMRDIDPELKRLRKELKEKPEELARRTLALFKEKKINPFASILLVFLQLPVILGLYFVFLSEAGGAGFDPNILYAFIQAPLEASFTLLNLVDLTTSSMVLAFLVAVSQYGAARIMIPPTVHDDGEEKSFQKDLAHSMQIQMKYVFPIVMGVFAYIFSAAIALYLLVSNLFIVGQELYVRKMHAKSTPS